MLSRNAQFHAAAAHMIRFLPTLRILGSRLERVKLDRYQDACTIDEDEWAAAGSVCSNLWTLFADLIKVEQIRAIVATPKHQLKEIRIFSLAPRAKIDSNAENIMDIIVEGAKKVEIFHFLCIRYDPSLGALDKFIDNNKSTFRSFSITNETSRSLHPSVVSEIIPKLLECTVLEEVTFEGVPAQSALETLRNCGL